MILLGNVLFFFRSDTLGGGRVDMTNRLTKHLLVDAVFFIMVGVIKVGFAEMDFSFVVSGILSNDIIDHNYIDPCHMYNIITLTFNKTLNMEEHNDTIFF